MTDQMEMYSTIAVLHFTTYLEKQMCPGKPTDFKSQGEEKPFFHLPAIFVCNFIWKTKVTNTQLPDGG